MTDKTLTRRGFIGATAGAIPVTAILASRTAAAQAQKALPHLDPADPVAKALNYHLDVTKSDMSKVSGFKAGSDCANCIQIQAASGAFRPCGAFPGKLVSEKGWCSAWAKKPG